MGGLIKTPKAPQPQTVAIATPIQQSPPAGDQTLDYNSGEQRSRERVQNLLARERGRFGTIATSFQGLLGQGQTQNENTQARKTLLGE